MTSLTHRSVILYVYDGGDDDQICNILRGAGHHVLQARSGAEAIIRAVDTALDVVILDLSLNDMSVAELIRELRTQPGGRAAGLLSITDRKHRPRAFRGLEQGADAYLLRPVDGRGLLAQVDALLRMRRAEQRARRFAREWRVAFDAITDAILVLSGDGEVVRCNRAALRLLARPREQLIGRHYRDLFVDAKGFPELLERPCEPVLTEVSVGDRWYRLAVDPVADELDPSAVGGEVVTVLTDLTEVKRYEEELRRHAAELEVHNQRQMEFLRMLSHELRNPLAAISAAVAIMEEERPAVASTDGVPQLAPLNVVRRQVDHLTHMMADLLDISRISAGKIELQLAVHDLRDIGRSALASVSGAVKRAGHTLRAELGDEPLLVRLDPTRFEQVLTNVLDNAIKYTPPSGTIHFHMAAGPKDERVQITISDTGVGLPDEAALDDVFEMFVQYERTLARAQGGLGIGLSLARTLVEMHGGEISASSEGTGRGTEINIRIPRVRQSPSHPPPSPGRQRQRGSDPAATPRHVLLVEDNEDLRQLVAFRLQRAGHRVRQANSGPEGLRMAMSEAPDVLVLDIGLPEMDGYQLVRELRKQEALKNALMIALTGYGSADARQAALEAGFDAHLIKPVDLNRLQHMIEGGPDAER